MISFKKAIFILGVGIGLSAAVNAWAYPACSTCEGWRLDCQDGNATACANYNQFRCYNYYSPGSCEV
jgi:hypothetical protein